MGRTLNSIPFCLWSVSKIAVTNFIPEIWAAEILLAFQQLAVLAHTITDYSGEMRTGDKIKVSEFAIPTVVDYQTGTSGARTIDPEVLTDSGIEITLDRERAFGFYVDDIDARQAAGSIHGPALTEAGLALAEDYDSALAALLLASGTAVTATVTDSTTAYQLVLNLRTQLSNLKVPPGGRTLAVNPLFSEFLLGADSKLVGVIDSGSPAGLRDATIGRLLDFNVIEDALLNPAAACAVAYHTSSVGGAIQMDKTEALRSPNRFADILRGLTVSGFNVLRPSSVLTWHD